MERAAQNIAINGPESSGKSTLAIQLANHFSARYVEEYARTYIQEIQGPYSESDVLHIARKQVELEQEATSLCFFDTDAVNLKVWFREKGWPSPSFMEGHLASKPYSFAILCYPDLPWEYDPVRENPDNRIHLYHSYANLYQSLNIPFITLTGKGENRFSRALAALEQILE